MKKWLSVVVLLLALNGCIKRRLGPAVAHLVLPRTCVTDMRFTQNAVCHPRPDGSFSCNGVILRAACTKLVAPPTNGASPTGQAQK